MEIMEPTPIQKMIVVARQQIFLYKATHKEKPAVCQWCLEEPVIEGKTVCRSCIDSIQKQNEENKDFNLDNWLEGDKIND